MRKIILGTDWFTDCDDCVALRLLARAHKGREIKLLGVGANTRLEHTVPSIDGFLHLEGVDDVPLGIVDEVVDPNERESFQPRLAAHAVRYPSNDDAEDAAALYRRLLEEVDVSTGKAEIIEIGYLGPLAKLLKSEGGVDLVREKVERIWCMGGKWDEDGGREHNFCRYPLVADHAASVLELCPVPMTFLGFEVGLGVISGARLESDDHLKAALCDHGSHNGRHSWDPMTVLLMLIGDAEEAGYGIVRGRAAVERVTGANHFEEDADGPHEYVIKKKPEEWYAAAIDALIG